MKNSPKPSFTWYRATKPTYWCLAYGAYCWCCEQTGLDWMYGIMLLG